MDSHSATDHRQALRRQSFHIALVLIAGTLLLIGIPTLRDNVQGAKELAAIFSGWIAAIVGFYFFQGQAQQAVAAAEEAERARNTATLRRMGAAIERLEAQNENLEKTLQEVINSLPDYEEAEGR